MIHESRRIYGRVKDLSQDLLEKTFARLPYINLALLFGSRAGPRFTDTGNGQSDYDFAVLMDKSTTSDWGHLAQARTDIGRLLELPDEDFDVVDLEVASPHLIDSIREQYLVLKGDVNEVRRLLGEHKEDCRS